MHLVLLCEVLFVGLPTGLIYSTQSAAQTSLVGTQIDSTLARNHLVQPQTSWLPRPDIWRVFLALIGSGATRDSRHRSPGSASLYATHMTETAVLARRAIVQRGRRLEYFTIAWNTLEGLIAIAAGVIAASISLVGFGVASHVPPESRRQSAPLLDALVSWLRG